MLTIYKVIQVLLWLVIFPMIIGYGIQKWAEKNANGPYALLYGTMFGWFVFEVLSVPAIRLQAAFHYVVFMWCFIQIIMVIGVCYCNRDCLKQFCLGGQIRKGFLKQRTVIEIVLILLTCLIIIAQMGMYVFGMSRDDDDARYVANAVAAVANDTMLLTNPYTGETLDAPVGELLKDSVSPWMMYVAAISKISKIHPAIMTHTVLPPILLLLTYIAYLVLANSLFEKDAHKKKILFLFFVSFFVMFASVSIYSATTFSLTRIWQGKSIVAAVIVPLIYGFVPRFLEQQTAYKQYAVLLMINGASCLLSGVGIVLSGLMVGGLLFTYAIQTRKIAVLVLGMICCVPNLITGLLYMSV